MRTLRFTKMHGLCNDFMMLNAFKAQIPLSEQEIRYLGDRHCGVGFDQLLIVEAPTLPQAHFKYRIFNPDGKEVEQCGNGARCFAKFVIDQGLTQAKSFAVETARGIITPRIEEDGQVTVDMGIPDFEPSSLPLNGVPDAKGRYTLPLDPTLNLGSSIAFEAVSMGNPHAVIAVPSVENAPVESLGAWLESHPAFPQRVNVEFVETLDRQTLRIRIFERGVGETLACGTGACAVAAAGLRSGRLEGRVTVHMRGGSLQIEWAGGEAPLFMTGPAVTVFHGECLIPESLAL